MGSAISSPSQSSLSTASTPVSSPKKFAQFIPSSTQPQHLLRCHSRVVPETSSLPLRRHSTTAVLDVASAILPTSASAPALTQSARIVSGSPSLPKQQLSTMGDNKDQEVPPPAMVESFLPERQPDNVAPLSSSTNITVDSPRLSDHLSATQPTEQVAQTQQTPPTPPSTPPLMSSTPPAVSEHHDALPIPSILIPTLAELLPNEPDNPETSDRRIQDEKSSINSMTDMTDSISSSSSAPDAFTPSQSIAEHATPSAGLVDQLIYSQNPVECRILRQYQEARSRRTDPLRRQTIACTYAPPYDQKMINNDENVIQKSKSGRSLNIMSPKRSNKNGSKSAKLPLDTTAKVSNLHRPKSSSNVQSRSSMIPVGQSNCPPNKLSRSESADESGLNSNHHASQHARRRDYEDSSRNRHPPVNGNGNTRPVAAVTKIPPHCATEGQYTSVNTGGKRCSDSLQGYNGQKRPDSDRIVPKDYKRPALAGRQEFSDDTSSRSGSVTPTAQVELLNHHNAADVQEGQFREKQPRECLQSAPLNHNSNYLPPSYHQRQYSDNIQPAVPCYQTADGSRSSSVPPVQSKDSVSHANNSRPSVLITPSSGGTSSNSLLPQGAYAGSTTTSRDSSSSNTSGNSSNASSSPGQGQFVRGNAVRSSLPVIRSQNTSFDTPIGLIFLVHGEETKKALLPNEITSLDTVRALFVRSFAGKLDMKYLDSAKRKIYILDPHTKIYYQLEDLRDIKDHSVLRVHECESQEPQRVREVVEVRGKTIQTAVCSPLSHRTTGTQRTQANIQPQPAARCQSAIPYDMLHPEPKADRLRSMTPNTVYQSPPQGHYERPPSQSFAPPAYAESLPKDNRSTTRHPSAYGYHYPMSSEPRREDGNNVRRSASPLDARNVHRGIPDAHRLVPQNQQMRDGQTRDGQMRDGQTRDAQQRIIMYDARNAPPSAGHPYYRAESPANQIRPISPLDGRSSAPLMHPHNTSPQSHYGRSQSYRVPSYNSREPVYTWQMPPRPQSCDPETKNRMDKMELQLANLAAWVHSDMELACKRADESPGTTPGLSPAHMATGSQSTRQTQTLPHTQTVPHTRPMTQPPINNTARLVAMKRQASWLTAELRNIRTMHVNNLEYVKSMLSHASRKIQNILSLIALNSMSASERMTMESMYQEYILTGEETWRILDDLESSMEEIRTDVTQHQCHVTLSDVEAFALSLSQVAKKLADMKGQFPHLHQKMKAVMSHEMKVVVKEEKFVKEEPERIETGLRRCKRLKATLYTLKRLAVIQEDRPPKVPLVATVMGTPSASDKRAMLENIEAMIPDHQARLSSIEAADLSRERKKKLINGQDVKMFERALQMKVKCLRPTVTVVSEGLAGGVADDGLPGRGRGDAALPLTKTTKSLVNGAKSGSDLRQEKLLAREAFFGKEERENRGGSCGSEVMGTGGMSDAEGGANGRQDGRWSSGCSDASDGKVDKNSRKCDRDDTYIVEKRESGLNTERHPPQKVVPDDQPDLIKVGHQRRCSEGESPVRMDTSVTSLNGKKVPPPPPPRNGSQRSYVPSLFIGDIASPIPANHMSVSNVHASNVNLDNVTLPIDRSKSNLFPATSTPLPNSQMLVKANDKTGQTPLMDLGRDVSSSNEKVPRESVPSATRVHWEDGKGAGGNGRSKVSSDESSVTGGGGRLRMGDSKLAENGGDALGEIDDGEYRRVIPIQSTLSEEEYHRAKPIKSKMDTGHGSSKSCDDESKGRDYKRVEMSKAASDHDTNSKNAVGEQTSKKQPPPLPQRKGSVLSKNMTEANGCNVYENFAL